MKRFEGVLLIQKNDNLLLAYTEVKTLSMVKTQNYFINYMCGLNSPLWGGGGMNYEVYW